MTSTNYDCIIVIVGCFMAAVVILFGVFIWLNHRHRKAVERIMTYQVNVAASIGPEIPELLNLIIQECFRDYEVTFLAPMNEQYINEDREKEIRKDVVDIVINRLSPAALDKLSLFYNPDKIANILADKIYIKIMSYVADHNATFISEK